MIKAKGKNSQRRSSAFKSDLLRIEGFLMAKKYLMLTVNRKIFVDYKEISVSDKTFPGRARVNFMQTT